MSDGSGSGASGLPNGHIVHELRQSLGTIMALAGAARLQDGVPATVVDLLRSIESEVERASTISRRIGGEEP